MPEVVEYFDVVDDDDNVIARQPRDVVHANNLLHRAVHALVYDDSGRLYLQKRTASKDVNPGLWDTSMAGHLHSGETYDQAVIRETREELGINLPSAPRSLFKLDACVDTGYEFIRVYEIYFSGVIKPCAREIEQGLWVSEDDLAHWLQFDPGAFTSSFKLIRNRIFGASG